MTAAESGLVHTLENGEHVVRSGDRVLARYLQPYWLTPEQARAVAINRALKELTHDNTNKRNHGSR